MADSLRPQQWLNMFFAQGCPAAQATLTQIHHQQIIGLREAIEDLSKGRTAEGFDKLDKFGAIQEIPDDADRLAAIAEKHI
jgi:hypothetical protein